MWPRHHLHHERQVGGWCRLHAVNACLGGPCYDQSSLTALSAKYAALTVEGAAWHPSGDILLDHGTHGGAFRFECFAFETATQGRFFAIHVPGRLIGPFHEKLGPRALSAWMEEAVASGAMHCAIMAYNPGHIYCIRRELGAGGGGGQWFMVDSMNASPYATTPSVVDRIERRDGFGFIACFRVEAVPSTVLHPLRRLACSMLAARGFRSAEHIYGLITRGPAGDYGEAEFPLLCVLRWMTAYGVASAETRRMHDTLSRRFGVVVNDPSLVETVLLPAVLVVLEGQPGCGWGREGTKIIRKA